jgi:hypothetical protein
MSRPVQPQRIWIVLITVLLLAAMFHLATIRDGHLWGDDFARYIQHAKNLLEGRDYAAGFIHNPLEPGISPTAYPPVTSLILLPVYWFAGLYLPAMKAVLVVFFIAGLLMFFLIARDFLPAGWSVIVVALVAFHPVYWEAKDQINSDLLFLCPLWTSLWLAHRTYTRLDGLSPTSRIGRALLLGLLLYLTSATRTLGVLLIPVLLLYDLIRTRGRPSAVTGVVIGVAVLLMLGQSLLLPVPFYAGGHFSFAPLFMVQTAARYVQILSWFWVNEFSRLLAYLLFGATFLLTGLGLWTTLRRSVSIYHVFIALYCGALSVFVYPHTRYLFPLFPLALLWAGVGLCTMRRRLPAGTFRVVALSLVGLTVFGEGTRYSVSQWGPFREGISDPDFRAMCELVRERTKPDMPIIFRKPRLLSLMTDRSGSVYPLAGDTASIANYIETIRAGYLIVTNLVSPEDFLSDRHLKRYVSEYGNRLELVGRRGPFTLYRVLRQADG